MAKKLPEITLTVRGYEWGKLYGTTPQTVQNACAEWRDDKARYHVWLARDASKNGAWVAGGTIWKNLIQYSGRAYSLDPNAASNRAVYAEVLRLANETSALQDDAERRYAEGLREIAEERRKDAAAVKEAFDRALVECHTAGEITPSRFIALADATAELSDENWLTLARAVRKA
jgi:hypothetical protein